MGTPANSHREMGGGRQLWIDLRLMVCLWAGLLDVGVPSTSTHGVCCGERLSCTGAASKCCSTRWSPMCLRGGRPQEECGPMAVDSNDAHSAGRGLRNAAPEPRVVALGGFVMGSESDRVTDVVESFSPHQGGWNKEPHLPVVTAGHCAETMHGNLYIMGGHDMRFLEHEQTDANPSDPARAADYVWPTLDSVWRLDTARGQWLPAPSMFARRTAFGSAAIDGRIYVAGGFNGEDFVSSFESFDPRERTWRRLPAFPRPRSALAMSAVQAGGGSYLVACGGVAIGPGEGGGMLDLVDIFDVRKGAWVEGPAMLGVRSGSAAASLDDKLFVMGGVGINGALGGVEIFDIRTLKWQRDLSDAMCTPRSSLAAVAFRDSIITLGGYDRQGEPSDVVEIYDLERGWREGPSLSFARGMLAATLSQ